MFRKKLVINIVLKSNNSIHSRMVDIEYSWYHNPCIEIRKWINEMKERVEKEIKQEVVVFNINIIK